MHALQLVQLSFITNLNGDIFLMLFTTVPIGQYNVQLVIIPVLADTKTTSNKPRTPANKPNNVATPETVPATLNTIAMPTIKSNAESLIILLCLYQFPFKKPILFFLEAMEEARASIEPK